MDKNVTKPVSIAISAVSLVFAVISYFLLPEKIFVEVFSKEPVPETGTLFFLTVGFLMVAVAGAMSIFNENGKKWIALQSVLFIGYIGCLVYNLIVL